MIPFTPTHHALLFAWIAQAAVECAGQEQGQAAVRQAVRRYGEQRGGRMAQRAQADGQPLDMTRYMAYGEWQAALELFETEMDAIPEAPRSLVFRCPWHQAWVENGVNEAGRLYCLEIDEALARGFNPALRLEINGTRSNGADFCEFVYHNADLKALAETAVDRSRTVMPWDFHLGHLYQAMFRVLGEELGPPGKQAAEAGLAVFANHFGAEAAQRVRAYLEVDFCSI
jgi:hypothetical protein